MAEPLGPLAFEDPELGDEPPEDPRSRYRHIRDPLERLRARTAAGAAAPPPDDPLERLRQRTTLPRAAPLEATPPRRFDPEGAEYDYASATAAGLTPDASGHWPSRVPETGLLLKGKQHPTWAKTEEGEAAAGMAIRKGPDGRYYSRPLDVTAALGREAQARLATAPTPAEATNVQVRQKRTPEIRAVPEPSALKRIAGQIVEQVRENVPTPGGLAGAETLTRRRERIAAREEAGTLTLEPGEAEELTQAGLGHLIGSFIDPTLLVGGAGAEKLSMTTLRAAAVHGVPLARKLVRLAETPAGAGFLRRLLARVVHGAVTGGPINVVAQAEFAAKEGRAPGLAELGEAAVTGAVAGPLFEAGGTLVALPFLPGHAARGRAAAWARLPKQRQAEILLRSAQTAEDPAHAAAWEAEAERVFQAGQGPAPEAPRAPGVERRVRPRAPGEGPLDRLRRRVASAVAGEDIEALKQQATTDPKTGALNARADLAATERALTERAEGQRIVRFRLDMDNFKALNDARGHAAGDEALQAMTDAIEAATRPEDLASLSRVGGDEFGVTMHVAEGADPAAIRDRLEQAVQAELERRGLHQAGERQVGASIGFAEATDEATAGSLDVLADAAAQARKAERAVSRPRAVGPRRAELAASSPEGSIRAVTPTGEAGQQPPSGREPPQPARPDELPEFHSIAVGEEHVLRPSSEREQGHPLITRGNRLGLATDGYGSLTDASLPRGEDITSWLQRNAEGTEPHDAITMGTSYTGTSVGPVQEMRYRLPGREWRYLYTIVSAEIDSWQQEWWSSSRRLSAEVAGEAMVAARSHLQDLFQDLSKAQRVASAIIKEQHPEWYAGRTVFDAPPQELPELYRRGLVRSPTLPTPQKVTPEIERSRGIVDAYQQVGRLLPRGRAWATKDFLDRSRQGASVSEAWQAEGYAGSPPPEMDLAVQRALALDEAGKRATDAEHAAFDQRLMQRALSEGVPPASEGGSPAVAGGRPAAPAGHAADTGALAPGTPLEPGWPPAGGRGGVAAYQPRVPPGPGVGTPSTGLSVPRRSQLVKDLAAALELPIRTGKMRQRKALGIYKVRPQVVRVRVANDIETIAHEVGHHVETLLFGDAAVTRKGELSNAVLQPWAAELKPLASGISDESLSEGAAEYFRLFLSHPTAAEAQAPQFHEFVTGRLARDHPDVLALLERKRDEYQLWLGASPQARLRAHVSTQDAPEHASVRDTWTRFRANVLDDMAWVERAVQDLREGKPLATLQEDAVTLARLTRGAEGLANEFLDGKARAFGTLKPVGKSLREVFAPVRNRLDDFRDYAVARRAQELHGRAIETGLIPSDVEAVLQELESPLFRQIFADLQTWNRQLLEYLKDAGVISPETLQAILEHNQAYLPFYRVMDDVPAGTVTYRSSRFGHVFSPVKRITGSGRDLIDPFESLVKNAQLYLQIAQRQQVSNALARLAERQGAGRWLERIPPPMVKKAGFTPEELAELFSAKGVGQEFEDFLLNIGFEKADQGWVLKEGARFQGQAEEMLTVFRPGDWFREPNVISVLREGKRTWYQVHPDLYDALMGLQHEHVDGWVRMLSLPARTLRAGATLAPEFTLRNPIRDQLQAFVTSEYGFKPGWDFAKGLWHLLRRDEMYGQWRATGGERASFLGLDRQSLRRSFRSTVARQGVPNVVYNPLELLRVLSSTMEDATRIGEFARAVAREGTSKEGLLRAAAASREVTVDFARHGAQLAGLRNMAAFWNARLQGYDRVLRSFRQHPARTSARIFAGITLPSIALYYVNRDDPDYWEIPLWQRNLFWLVKVSTERHAAVRTGLFSTETPTGTWLRIPKPFELGMVFATIPERMLEWWDTQDPHGLASTIGQFLSSELEQTAPVPTVVQPLIDNYANYNAFLRRPVVPKSLEGVAPEAQVTPYTSEIAEHLGRMVNYPPAKIDNLLYGWSGGLGRLGSDVATRGIGLLEPGEAEQFGPRATSRRLVDLPGPFDLREQTPGVRGFIARAPGAQSEAVERFYQQLAAAGVAYNTARFYEREENDAALEAWEAAHADEIDSYLDLRRTADELAGIRAEINGVRREPELSGEEKAAQIQALERELMQVAEDAIGFRTGAQGRRTNPLTRALGGVGDVLAGPGAGRIPPRREP